METLERLHLEIKEHAEDGSFVGVASTYGNIDRTGDRIEKGAFAEDSGKAVPLLFAHKSDVPVGLGKLEEGAAGVRISGKLNLETVAGKEAYSNLKAGIVRSLSIGFELLKHVFDGPTRVIQKGVIREVSLVLFPANEQARILAVKEAKSGCQCDCAECQAGDCAACSDEDCDCEGCTCEDAEDKALPCIACELLPYLQM